MARPSICHQAWNSCLDRVLKLLDDRREVLADQFWDGSSPPHGRSIALVRKEEVDLLKLKLETMRADND